MQQSPVYAAAVVLNPEHKWKFFAKSWEDHPDWIEEAEENVTDFWESMYKNYDDAGIGAQTAGLDTAGGLFRPESGSARRTLRVRQMVFEKTV